MSDRPSLERVQAVGVAVLATLATVSALYAAAEFLVPVVFAGVLAVLLRPTIRVLKRVGLPAAVAAILVTFAVMAVVAVAALALAAPARNALARTPQDFEKAAARLARFRQPIDAVSDVASKMERATQSPSTRASESQLPAPSVAAPASPNALLTRVAGSTTQVVGAAVEVLLLLYLFLAGDGLFLKKLKRSLRSDAAREIASDIVHESESVVMRYVLVTGCINLGQSTVIGLAMWWLGMPAPLMWGLFTFILEFVPYLGAMVMIVLLAATALATFDGTGHILLVPGVYLLVSGIQNNLVSPLAYGRGLALNPVAVLVGVIFWWFVWGVPGAFLAVPLLAMMKILGDRAPTLHFVGELLGE